MPGRTLFSMAMVWLLPALVAAQPPADLETAQRRFREGVAASEAGRWQEAVDAFEAAYAAAPNVRVLLNIGTARAQAGHLLAARDAYRQILAAADEQEIDAALSSAANEALAELRHRIPRVRVRATNNRPGDELQLCRDDACDALDRDGSGRVELDPGSYRVVVRRDGETVAEEAFAVEAGDQPTVVVEAPDPSPTATASPAPTPTPIPDTPTREADDGGSVFTSPWFWLVVGAVVVGAGVGLFFGLGLNENGPFEGNFGPGFTEVR